MSEQQETEKSAEIQITSNMVAVVLNWAGASIAKNGWPATMFFLLVLFIWHVWGRAEPILWNVAEAQIKAMNKVADSVEGLTKNLEEQTKIVGSLSTKTDQIVNKTDQISTKLDELHRSLVKRPGSD